MAQNQTRGTIVKPEHMQTMLNEVVDMLPKKFSAADLSILIPHIVLSYGMEESWPQIIMYSTKTLGENLCEELSGKSGQCKKLLTGMWPEFIKTSPPLKRPN
jgi:hypothetical protein